MRNYNFNHFHIISTRRGESLVQGYNYYSIYTPLGLGHSNRIANTHFVLLDKKIYGRTHRTENLWTWGSLAPVIIYHCKEVFTFITPDTHSSTDSVLQQYLLDGFRLVYNVLQLKVYNRCKLYVSKVLASICNIYIAIH